MKPGVLLLAAFACAALLVSAVPSGSGPHGSISFVAPSDYHPEPLAAGGGPSTRSSILPSPREYAGIAYDVQSDKIVLFGGSWNNTELNNETWAYDFTANTWTLMHPAPAPSQLEPAMSYDSKSDRVILFGGFAQSGNRETWSYDFNANTWTRMNPSTAPSRREYPAMAYDTESDRVILFGGSGGGDQTWAYDLETDGWTLAGPIPSPSARYGHAMAYDSQSDRVILFGGFATNAPSDETWSYDTSANTWTMMSPVNKPSARMGHAMAYDSQSDRVVLFGGAGASNEIWAYDYDTDKWTNLQATSAPPGSTNAAMAYDSKSGQVVLFGGSTVSGTGGETWTYDSNSNDWTRMNPTTVPATPRSVVANPGVSQIVLSWAAPISDGGSPVTNFKVYRGTVPGGPTLLTTLGTAVSYTDGSVTDDVTYDYQVSAVNAVGEGPLSAGAFVTPLAPPPPADTTKPTLFISSPADGATLTSTEASVSGTASDDVDVEKVEVSLDGTTWTTAAGTTAWSATLTLVEGSNTIHVRVTDTSGNTATATIQVVVHTSTGPSGQVEGQGLPAWVWPLVAFGIATTAVAILLVRRRRRPVG